MATTEIATADTDDRIMEMITCVTHEGRLLGTAATEIVVQLTLESNPLLSELFRGKNRYIWFMMSPVKV